MLQIDHIYEFLYQEIFKDFEFWFLPGGVPKLQNINLRDIAIFTHKKIADRKIFLYDQEPLIPKIYDPYLKLFDNALDPRSKIFVTSEHSSDIPNSLYKLYYFFHGFAALDWYRGYYALNYRKSAVKKYQYDFITFNRIITKDRSYRLFFISLLKENNLLGSGLISFNVIDDMIDNWEHELANSSTKLSIQAQQHIEKHLTGVDKLVIDDDKIHGSASASIPRTINGYWPNNDQPNYDAFWHVVTETVFYYDKLHLTEKIFKPIVSKQPFMLLAAPGNLAYLRSYGFKTFDGIIDESYDKIQDNDLRITSVVKELTAYCKLSESEKNDMIEELNPIIQHNFDHFYGEFRHIITRELLDNIKTLFKELGYDDGHINYIDIYHVLTH